LTDTRYPTPDTETMKRRLEGIVEAVEAERPGAQEVRVRVDGNVAAEPASDNGLRLALNIVALTGRVAVGDKVRLNTVAVEMNLGTGGLDFIITNERPVPEEPPPGHVLKLRYTPLQTPVLAVEAPESPHHDALRLFASLDDMPVVCAELHSQIPAICAAAHWELTTHDFPHPPRLVYIMTDGAALPLALSRLVPQMKEKGLIAATITAGQAFGGDYEAVNLYSAMAAAKEVAGADIIVVGQGPGNVGTGTPLGFSGVDQGLAVNAAASLGGVPIVVPRISFSDERPRHGGLSHHTLTVLCNIARAPVLLPIPRLPKEQQRRIQLTLETAEITEEHQPIVVDADKGLNALVDSGINVKTMGRSLAEERPFFLAAAAAGLLAAQLVEARTEE
jgi:hypothetical protein